MRRLVIVLVLAALAVPRSLGAHAAPFSYLDLKISSGTLDGTLVVHDFDVAHDLGIADPTSLHNPEFAAKYRDMLTRLMDSRLTLSADGGRRTLEWTNFETLAERQ